MQDTISLTSSTRSNLLSLQQTQKILDRTQVRLATGKKINSAIDNASAYYTSQGFLQRADDFKRIKDSLANGLQALQAVSNALDAITKVVNQGQGLVIAAQQSNDPTVRASYATQFNGLLTQINNLVSDSSFNGINLLTGVGSLTLNFNESAAIELTISSVDTTAAAGGLNIGTASGSWVNNTQIDAASTDLESALATLRGRAATFGNNNTVIETRAQFADGLISVLQVASDNLVLADTNEEGAIMQAMQARYQLGVVSLGISGEQAQAILRLF